MSVTVNVNTNVRCLEKRSTQYPYTGFDRKYSTGTNINIRPMAVLEIPSCLPITFRNGRIGPRAGKLGQNEY